MNDRRYLSDTVGIAAIVYAELHRLVGGGFLFFVLQFCLQHWSYDWMLLAHINRSGGGNY